MFCFYNFGENKMTNIRNGNEEIKQLLSQRHYGLARERAVELLAQLDQIHIDRGLRHPQRNNRRIRSMMQSFFIELRARVNQGIDAGEAQEFSEDELPFYRENILERMLPSSTYVQREIDAGRISQREGYFSGHGLDIFWPYATQSDISVVHLRSNQTQQRFIQFANAAHNEIHWNRRANYLLNASLRYMEFLGSDVTARSREYIRDYLNSDLDQNINTNWGWDNILSLPYGALPLLAFDELRHVRDSRRTR